MTTASSQQEIEKGCKFACTQFYKANPLPGLNGEMGFNTKKNVGDFNTQLLLINQSFQIKKKSYHKSHDDLSAWSIAVLPPASVLMSVDPLAIRSHSDVHGLYHHLGPCWCPRATLPIWIACIATQGHGHIWAQTAEGHICVHGPAAAEIWVDVHCPHYYRGPGESCMLKTGSCCASLAPHWPWESQLHPMPYGGDPMSP